ncbi:MAG: amylo-alpha-1,6-glucosidase [Acidobacteriota bacterium]
MLLRRRIAPRSWARGPPSGEEASIALSEWLESDGRGGFASGTAGLVRTRRYHALLLSAADPPARRFALVSGVEASVETPDGRRAISAQAYAGGVEWPDGASRLARFDAEPWPRWTFRLEDGTEIEHEVFVSRESGATVVLWRAPGGGPGIHLEVRPLLSGRNFHALRREDPSLRFEPETRGSARTWRVSDGVPEITIDSNGEYRHEPVWYRDFFYAEEAARGFDASEDLASPGVFRFDLSVGEAVLILASGPPASAAARAPEPAARASALRGREIARRAAFPSRLTRAADDYIVSRGAGRSIVAGYPWFGEWGRDTFIALRGVCLATGRLDAARDVLLEWSGAVSEGMLPNRFPDEGEAPEYNSVDASLWYVIAVHDWLAASRRLVRREPAAVISALLGAVEKILEGHARGARYGIRSDADGLLAAGEPGVALTWMDARVDGLPVTARAGKPVEIQALWVNALTLAASRVPRWRELARRASAAFDSRFWRENEGCLFDVVDCDGVPGAVDPAFRPNQIFAVGGLPYPLVSGERARRIVEAVERRLWTPLGLRSLAPGEPQYAGRYAGGPVERDRAYHQGTVWPWLIGPFVEAWVRVRGGGDAVRAEARQRFLSPLLAHSDSAGLGHIPEVADGDPPHEPGGCPFQAWSVGEALRLDLDVLSPRRPGSAAGSGR